MKVYLAVPLVANRSRERAVKMAEAIKEAGHELTSPWVLGVPEGEVPGGINVFDRDSLGASACDVLVADVSSPSTGVGMEVMAASLSGRRVILAWRKGSVVSNMLKHMKDKEVIEFSDDSDLAEKLLAALGTDARPRRTD